MKKIIICALFTVLFLILGCSKTETVTETELTLWTTSQPYAQSYKALALEWNKENPSRPIHLDIQIYSPQRITGKLSSAFYSGTQFGSESIPDLVDIDYAFFRDYLSDHKTEFYPLENILKNNNVSQQIRQNSSFYSSNQICFALPYSHQQLLLCYRLDLGGEFSELVSQTKKFEGLASLGAQKFRLSDDHLLEADYLGAELFLSLFLRALDTDCTEEEAYQTSLELLQRMHKSGASSYLSCGDAYGDAFGGLLAQRKLGCFVTTAANLSCLAQSYPEAAQDYGIMALPGFQGVYKDVSLPAMATAVYLSSEHVILARDFLEFCRFSEAARAYPLLHLGGEEDLHAILSGYGALAEKLSWGSAVDSAPVDLLAQKIPLYSQAVLSSET